MIRMYALESLKNLEFLFLESNDISELPIVGWRAAFQDSDNLQMWELEKQSFKQRFIEFVETELIGR